MNEQIIARKRLRERASIAAMQGLLANTATYETLAQTVAENRHIDSEANILDVVVQTSVAYADALIKELLKTEIL